MGPGEREEVRAFWKRCARNRDDAALFDLKRTRGQPRAKRPPVSLSAYDMALLLTPRPATPEEICSDAEKHDLVRAMIRETLPPPVSRALTLSCGLGPDDRVYSLTEISPIMEISGARVGQLADKGARMLKNPRRAARLVDFSDDPVGWHRREARRKHNELMIEIERRATRRQEMADREARGKQAAVRQPGTPEWQKAREAASADWLEKRQADRRAELARGASRAFGEAVRREILRKAGFDLLSEAAD